MFSTVFIGVFNLQDGTLTYINCGNEPPLVISNGAVLHALSPTGPVVGVMPEAIYNVKEIVLAKDQVLFAFTDGVPDALNADNIPFGKDRLREGFCKSQTGSSGILKNVETQLHEFYRYG